MSKKRCNSWQFPPLNYQLCLLRMRENTKKCCWEFESIQRAHLLNACKSAIENHANNIPDQTLCAQFSCWLWLEFKTMELFAAHWNLLHFYLSVKLFLLFLNNVKHKRKAAKKSTTKSSRIMQAQWQTATQHIKQGGREMCWFCVVLLMRFIVKFTAVEFALNRLCVFIL